MSQKKTLGDRLREWRAISLISRDDYPKAPTQKDLLKFEKIIDDVERTEAALMLCRDELLKDAKEHLYPLWGLNPDGSPKQEATAVGGVE